MLLADVTFIFLAQCPLLRTVSLEVSQERVIIIFNPLVEYKLRVIYEPGYDELIDFVIIKSTMPLFHLAGVYSFEVVHNFLLFAKQDMIFVFLSLHVQSLSFFKHTSCRLGLMKAQVAPHDVLIVNCMSLLKSYWLIKFADNFTSIIFSQIFFAKSEDIQNIRHEFLRFSSMPIDLIVIQMYR
jgi:hypothetical protein